MERTSGQRPLPKIPTQPLNATAITTTTSNDAQTNLPLAIEAPVAQTPVPLSQQYSTPYLPQLIPVIKITHLPDYQPQTNLQQVRPRSNTPGHDKLLEKLSACKNEDEVRKKCNFLLSQIQHSAEAVQYKIFHALEKIASEWILSGQPDFARIVFSKLDASITGDMNRVHLQIGYGEDFEENCKAILADAKANKSEEELQKIIFEYREKVQELLLLGRPEYALIILEKLIACGCVAKDDKEACTYMKLIQRAIARGSVHASTVSWATEGGRTASLYAYALIVLGQQSLVNLSAAFAYFQQVAELGYKPAEQACSHIKRLYPEALPACVNKETAKRIAVDIASEAGFQSGFNLDEKHIYSI